jgi:hypothetical protein
MLFHFFLLHSLSPLPEAGGWEEVKDKYHAQTKVDRVFAQARARHCFNYKQRKLLPLPVSKVDHVKKQDRIRGFLIDNLDRGTPALLRGLWRHLLSPRQRFYMLGLWMVSK